jgi:hypothetical protein
MNGKLYKDAENCFLKIFKHPSINFKIEILNMINFKLTNKHDLLTNIIMQF